MESVENGNTAIAASQLPPLPVPAKKRSRHISILRAVMQAFSSGSPKKSSVGNNAIVDASTADTVIKSLVSSFRPLHQLDYCPAPPPPPPDMVLDAYYDVHAPPSPCHSLNLSRYASAEDLPSLVVSDIVSEENDEEEADNNGEPNAIDKKADEFIAMFYKEMKQQQMDSLKVSDEGKAMAEESEESPKTVEEKTELEAAADLLRIAEQENATVEESESLPEMMEEKREEESALEAEIAPQEP